MALVKRGGKSVASRVGQALEGVGQAAKGVADFKIKLQNAKTQQAFAQNQAEFLSIKKDEAEQRNFEAHHLNLNSIFSRGIRINDKKGYGKVNRSSIEKSLQAVGSPETADQFIERMSLSAQEFGPAAEQMSQAVAAVVGQDLNSKQLEAITQKGLQAFDKLLAIDPRNQTLREEKRLFLGAASDRRKALERTEEQRRVQQAKEQQAVVKEAKSLRKEDRQLAVKFTDQVRTDSQLKDLGKSLEQAKRVESLAKEALTNPIAAGTVSRAVAKAAGEVGRLTEEDVKAFQLGAAGSLPQRFTSTMKKMAKGTLTEEEVQFLTNLSAALEQRIQTDIGNRRTELARAFSKATNISEQDLIEFAGGIPGTQQTDESKDSPATRFQRFKQQRKGQ